MGVEHDIPYYEGSGLACVTMVLAHLGCGEHLERELRALLGELDLSHIPPEERPQIDQLPDVHVELLHRFERKFKVGVGCRKRTDGSVSKLRESLAHDRDVIVYLGAKALRKSGPRVKIAQAGYQAVVVTRAGHWRVVFHDPDPQRGRANRSMRRGRHLLAQGWTFENAWSVWQGWQIFGGYLTMKTPELSPAARLEPWVFVEAWRG